MFRPSIAIRFSSKRRLTLLMTSAVFLGASATSWAQDDESDPAVKRIRQFYDSLLDVMKQADRLGIRGRYEKLAPVIRATFDLAAMTRIAVGPDWNAIAPE